MKNPEKVTWIVAIVGMIIFIILAYASMVMWNLAHPIPKTPEDISGLPEHGLPSGWQDQPLPPGTTPAGCWQKIDPILDHVAGEVFVITETTNCKKGDRITVEIVSVSSGQSSRDFVEGGVEVRQLSPNDYGWSVTIDSSALGPGQKTVSACGVGICGFRTFTITE